jgi:hypothetical protein
MIMSNQPFCDHGHHTADARAGLASLCREVAQAIQMRPDDVQLSFSRDHAVLTGVAHPRKGVIMMGRHSESTVFYSVAEDESLSRRKSSRSSHVLIQVVPDNFQGVCFKEGNQTYTLHELALRFIDIVVS